MCAFKQTHSQRQCQNCQRYLSLPLSLSSLYFHMDTQVFSLSVTSSLFKCFSLSLSLSLQAQSDESVRGYSSHSVYWQKGMSERDREERKKKQINMAITMGCFCQLMGLFVSVKIKYNIETSVPLVMKCLPVS